MIVVIYTFHSRVPLTHVVITRVDESSDYKTGSSLVCVMVGNHYPFRLTLKNSYVGPTTTAQASLATECWLTRERRNNAKGERKRGKQEAKEKVQKKTKSKASRVRFEGCIIVRTPTNGGAPLIVRSNSIVHKVVRASLFNTSKEERNVYSAHH